MAWYGRSSGFCRTLLRSFERYKTPLLDGSRRFFHDKVQKNPRKLVRTGLLGCGVVTSLYYWNVERVPFSKRSHFLLFPTFLEREFGNLYFEEDIKPKYEGKILPPLHPLSVRVQRIGQEIVEAARKGLKKEEECMLVKLFKKLGKRDYDQIPEFDWEFFVVDEPICNAECYPGGKLVNFTGFIDVFESDAKIATAIGHEVGHAMARHAVEDFSRLPGLAILQLVLYWSINLHLVPAISKFLARLAYCGTRHFAERLWCTLILKLFLYWKTNLSLIPAISEFLIRLPNSRRSEIEADYIGLMITARAGYDPGVFVEEVRLLETFPSDWLLGDYVYSHPTGKKRAQLLTQPNVMEEALSLYRKAKASIEDRMTYEEGSC